MSERGMSEAGAQHTLGQLIDESARRDAVHIAVAPARAGDHLGPGQGIALDAAGVAHKSTESVGIVDPFLKRRVEPGEWFWLWLMPNTITGLRHQWTHPAFDAEVPAQPSDRAASEAWLRDFIQGADCPSSYERVVAAAVKLEDGGGWGDRNEGEWLFFDGSDAHGDIPPEFWRHIEVVTGHHIPDTHRATYFSCSC
jgi:hypothetical protein